MERQKVMIKPCIDDTMLLDCNQELSPVLWNDHGSGGDHDVTIFALDGPPGSTVDGYGAAANIGNMQGFWRATKGHVKTLGGVFKCLSPKSFISNEWSSTAEWGPGVNGHQTFETGTAYSTSKKLTESQKSELATTLSASVTAGAYGVGVSSSYSLSKTYTRETSKELAMAASQTAKVTCDAPDCSGYNYTANELRIYQWGMSSDKVRGDVFMNGVASVTTCQFFCGSTYVYPRCPPASCADNNCQTCCTLNGVMVPCRDVHSTSRLRKPVGNNDVRKSVVFGVHKEQQV
mmetsp:Transcript_11058/g.17568  ORF Transcript_11058/g.17568 Transcript_11058/m.17568 type:complete len:290 (+) Transcript_11058:2-871(+)